MKRPRKRGEHATQGSPTIEGIPAALRTRLSGQDRMKPNASAYRLAWNGSAVPWSTVDCMSSSWCTAETGDIGRFTTARQLMDYLGLLPSERCGSVSVRRSREYQDPLMAVCIRVPMAATIANTKRLLSRETGRGGRRAFSAEHQIRRKEPVANALLFFRKHQ